MVAEELRRKNTQWILYYFVGLVPAIAASWGKFWVTGSPVVDNNPVVGNAVYLIVALFCLGLGLQGFAYYHLVFTYTLTLKTARKTAVGAVTLGSLMLPLLSNDVFLYLAYGNLLNQGMVTYVQPELIQYSDFVTYVATDWLDCPNHYSPILLMLFGMVTWLGKSLWASFVLLKILFWGISLAIIQLLYLFFHQLQASATHSNKYIQNFSLIVLAPIFWLQGVGQLHSEVVILLFIIGLMGSLYTEKWITAGLLVGLIAAAKIMYGAVFFPFLLLYLWFQYRTDWATLLNKVTYSVSIALGVIVLSYFPFWEGLATLTNPFAYHENKPLNHSVVGVLTDIIFYGQQLLLDAEAPIGQWVLENANGVIDKTMIAQPLGKAYKLFGLCLAGWVLLRIFI
ncbi:MAG: hypothetical protein AAGJ18_07835 [Bacteroidota bacterium]